MDFLVIRIFVGWLRHFWIIRQNNPMPPESAGYKITPLFTPKDGAVECRIVLTHGRIGLSSRCVVFYYEKFVETEDDAIRWIEYRKHCLTQIAADHYKNFDVCNRLNEKYRKEIEQ